MESTLRSPALEVGKTTRTTNTTKTAMKGRVIAYWVFTAIFCLQMGFTAYAQLRLPQVAAMFHHLGIPDYLRVELSWAKLLGVAVLLAPAPSRLKEWAYAGFAITLASALLAHLTLGDPASVWSWAAGTGVLWALSYVCWRRLPAAELRGMPR